MSSTALRSREEKRLNALHLSGLLDSQPEKIFDRLTELAAKALGVPVVLMSLVDTNRQFFKSKFGLPDELAAIRETPLSHSFCQFVTASDEPLVISDARKYPLVCDNPAVRDLNVVAYAGVPLITTDGQTLGSVCAIDIKPRLWSRADVETLSAVAAQMMSEINLRMQVGELNQDLSKTRELSGERKRRVRQNVHDLRTPVTAVLISLDAMHISGPLNEQQTDYLEMAKRNARVLVDLVNQLLKTGSLEEEGFSGLVFEFCSVKALVERAVEQVAPLAERAGISIDLSGMKELPEIRADERELLRVLVNLIANAVKFTPRGRRVAVMAEEVETDGWKRVRISVVDEGIGIAPEDQAQLFQDGGRLDHHADSEFSTGIGLAYCKRIVEAHGGQIEVRSAVGAGSTFSFFIPRDRISNSEPRI